MPDRVDGIGLEVVTRIQAGIAQLNEQLDHLIGRFEQLEAGMRKDRRNVAGMLVMVRATAGDFDERVSEIEERVAALEAQRQ